MLCLIVPRWIASGFLPRSQGRRGAFSEGHGARADAQSERGCQWKKIWSRLSARHIRLAGAGGALLLAAAAVLQASPAASAPLAAHRAAGAGHTIIEGGTGGSDPVPVSTPVAFRVTASGGDFECLALAPPQPTGPGSGAFTSNVMDGTGTVTSLSVSGSSAVFGELR